jgi:hypothetical protein
MWKAVIDAKFNIFYHYPGGIEDACEEPDSKPRFKPSTSRIQERYILSQLTPLIGIGLATQLQ